MEISSLLQHQHQHQHQQAMPSNQPVNMEEVMLATATGTKSADQSQEIRKPRPQPEQALKCPRCESTNTKFCYYNNYSLTQPRYFCKGCRRYWTQGGSLRNVPVGGGCRKNTKRSSSSKKPQDHHHQTLITPSSLPILPPLPYPPVDGLSLAPFLNPNPNPSSSFLDILRSGFLDAASPAGFGGYVFDGSQLGLNCPTTTTTTTIAGADGDHDSSKMAMGHQWQLSDGSDHNSSSYYNWHGIINSSPDVG